jgi:integrase/recombinase XerD
MPEEGLALVTAERGHLDDDHLAVLRAHLIRRGYRPLVIERYVHHAHLFLAHLDGRGVSIYEAGEEDVRAYLADALTSYTHCHGCLPSSIGSWRGAHTGGVRALLRVCGEQAPSQVPGGGGKTLEDYRSWLTDLRGLAPLSVTRYCAAARDFLGWMARRSPGRTLRQLHASDIDDYLAARAPSLRRVTRKLLANLLRSFLRHLHRRGVTEHDLSSAVWGTRVYEHERPPCGLKADEVEKVLASTRLDRTPGGRRDYAMLVLLATYGLRASEVVQLRLEAIDWRHERLRVQHSKLGPAADMPLLPSVGEALASYLRHGRPQTALRQVFVRTKAPHDRPLRGDGLYQIVCRRLRRAGVQPEGKHGPHAFRHGRAVELLRAGVSLKSIGDILGHRRPSTTQGYLRLHTEDLRDVALPVPRGR